MSETALAEEVVTQPDSTVETLASETDQDTSSITETSLDGTGADNLDTGDGAENDASKAPAPDKSPEDRYRELREKKNAAGLTPEEGVEYDRVEQSVIDRRNDEQKRINAVRAQEQRVAQVTSEVFKNFEEQFYAIEAAEQRLADEEGRNPSPAAIKRQQQALIESLKQAGEIVHQWPVHQDLNARIRAQQPQSARLEEWLADPRVTVKDKVDFLERIPRPPSADHVVLTKKELEAQKKAAAQAEVDRWKAANPGVSPPSGDTSRRPTGTPKLTLEEIEAMPTAVWFARYPDPAERERIRNAARGFV